MFRQIYVFLRDLIRSRELIADLAWRDFYQQFQGSYLGVVWAFLQPILFISILYAVFALGLRVDSGGDSPFILYLLCGIVPWLYFAAHLSAATGVISSYSYLVKKIDFRLSVLPLVKVLSLAPTHLVLLIISIFVAWYKGFPPTVYTLQVLYYFFAMILLLTGIGWLTSATSLFIKDIANVVAIVTQFGFWLTPIFWNIARIPEPYHWIVKLNPAFYIVTGYRESLIHGAPFWSRAEDMVIFWSITLFFLVSGITVYKKLRPHFAEVV